MHKLIKKGQNGLSFRDPNYKITLSPELQSQLYSQYQQPTTDYGHEVKIKNDRVQNYNTFSNIMGKAGGLYFYGAIC